MDTLHTTREAADIINEAGILPAATKPLTQRSVARLCKAEKLPGAYLAQGDWCVPSSAIDAFIKRTKSATDGRPPRKKKTA